jgi:osmoprotectant transport system ATP-binding protein
MAASALSAAGVRVVYASGAVALDGADLAVAPGETVAVIGESGSGKTTLLRLFNRMIEPSDGEVRVGGRDVRSLDAVALRRSLGYVPQDGGLLPHWTAGRNVELVPQLLGWPPPRRRERAVELLELVGLPPARFADRYPSELSGGERQRVAIARALAADPQTILLDEPFGALDALTRRELQDELLRVEGRLRKTILLVTHDLDEAIRLSDRVAVMREGRMLQIATPADLQRRPADPYVERLLALRGGAG